MTGLWLVAFVALWALVVLIGLVVLGTLRRITLLLEAAEASFGAAARASLGGLSVGSMVPVFAAQTVDGRVFFAEVDLEEERTGVLFLSRSCEACQVLADDLSRGFVPGDLGARLVVVSEDGTTAREFARSAEVTVLVDENREVAEAFDARIVPRAFIVVQQRVVLAAGRPNDWDTLRRLVATAGGGDGLADPYAVQIAL